jgi:putative transposase
VSRLKRIEQRERYFFVTTNRSPSVAELSAAERTEVLHALDTARRKHGFYLFSYVVMPTHVHMLLWPQRSDLSATLRDFKSKSALALTAGRKSQGALWQPRFFDFICRRVKDFHEKMEYIHNNPVEAGLTPQAAEWPWSSAAWHLRREQPLIPVDSAILPADGNALLWPVPWR